MAGSSAPPLLRSPAPLLPRSSAGFYDRLRHRLIFPIADALGRPIAFGGRKLREEDEPKYLNSPEHVLFNKSRTLYGLHLAKKPIIDSRVAVIVEGYTDVIACHQRGERNVVATLGTALTREHVAELRRFAEKVVLVFDADAAGEKAADRAVELFLTGDLDVAIAHLPPGSNDGKTDPFDLIRRDDGVALWRAAIAGAQDALDYQLSRVSDRLRAAETVTGRQRVIEEYVARVGQLGLSRAGTIRRAFVLQRLSDLLKLPESQVQALLKQQERPAAAPRVHAAPQAADPNESAFASENWPENDVARTISGRRLRALELAERHVIGSLLRDPGLFDRSLADGRAFDEAVTAAVFVSPAAAVLFGRLCDRLVEEGQVTLGRMIADLAEADRQDLCNLLTLADSEVENVPPVKVEEMWRDSCAALLQYHAERALEAARRSTDPDAMLRQRIEHNRLNRGKRHIARIQHD